MVSRGPPCVSYALKKMPPRPDHPPAPHGRHTMGFNIRLIDHIHTQPITKSVKTWLVRIVRTAHGIKIVLLHQAQVPFNIGELFEVPVGIVFVLVHANKQWLTIET